MTNLLKTDIAIVGGGIAGLWLLNLLRQQGFNVVLLETQTLGGEQTGKSQGIIHGGIKYALQGMLTPSAKAIADMPNIWKHCLQGRGEINLSNVSILSKQQLLWSTGSLASQMSGFLASVSLKSGVHKLRQEEFPTLFQHSLFAGQLYALDEIVLDIHSLITNLATPHRNCILKIDNMQENDITLDSEDHLISLKIKNGQNQCEIQAQKTIFTAGNGNETILKKLNQHTIEMQQRPLHMVMVKHNYNYPIYAHCLGWGNQPRITITTHRAHDGKTIWYLGGGLAEEGVNRNSETQIEHAQTELHTLFPWLDFSKHAFASFRIDRAEHKQPNGNRPSDHYSKKINNMIIAWPTKLAFAPQLTNTIMNDIALSGIQPQEYCSKDIVDHWPKANIANPPWEMLI